MKSALRAAEDFLNSQDCRFERVDDSTLLTHLGGRNVNFAAVLHADEEQRSLLVLAMCPVIVPKDRRLEVLELVAKLNWKMTLGSLQLGDAGEIRYRTSIMFGEAEAVEELVEHVFFSNLAMFDHHFPAITDVVFGGMKAQDAIDRNRPERLLINEAQAPKASRNAGFGGRLGKLIEGRN